MLASVIFVRALGPNCHDLRPKFSNTALTLGQEKVIIILFSTINRNDCIKVNVKLEATGSQFTLNTAITNGTEDRISQFINVETAAVSYLNGIPIITAIGEPMHASCSCYRAVSDSGMTAATNPARHMRVAT